MGHEKAVKQDMVIETEGVQHRSPFADEFKILEHQFSRHGRVQISLEEGCRAPTELDGECEVISVHSFFGQSSVKQYSIVCTASGCKNWIWSHAVT